MKKWEKPELKVLGVENTNDGVSMLGLHADPGKVWVCASCYGDPRGDIDNTQLTNVGNIYTTKNQTCGDCKVSKQWIQVDKNNRPPVITPVPPSVGLS